MHSIVSSLDLSFIPFGHVVPDGFRGQANTFEEIFLVFLILGTLVGVVVIGYMIYNAYKYRAAATPEAEFEAPEVGELPTGGAGGKKLFLSFAISAIIVIGLVAWTYTALLWVEAGAQEEVETEYDIKIEGIQFGWGVEYPDGETTFNEVYIPADTMVGFEVTSGDVWHTFGVTELRLKVDAIPGQTSTAWVIEEEEGTYLAECFELCGEGHSTMEADVHVIDRDEWESEFAESGDEQEDGNESSISDEPLTPPTTDSTGITGISSSPSGVSS